MDPRLSWESVGAVVAERRSAASAGRFARDAQRATHSVADPNTPAVTVRFATPDDDRALEQLAALDSKSVPGAAALVAEVDGAILAALPLRDGRALADPFRPTAELVRLLELRAAQLRGTHWRRPWLPRLRALGRRRTAAAHASGTERG
jgi:hypothetical protein